MRDKEQYISTLEEQLVESEERVEKLRCRIRTISSRKNSPVRGNSPDLYNSDDNMATITELANAIDSYVNNPTTGREILADQIKRTIRQIRQKKIICNRIYFKSNRGAIMQKLNVIIKLYEGNLLKG